MADPFAAFDKPKAAAPKPASASAFAAFDKPKAAAPKPATPKAQPSMFERIVQGTSDVFSAPFEALMKAPERAKQAQGYLRAEQNYDRAKRGTSGTGLGDAAADIKRRWDRNHMMRDAGRELTSDFSRPLDKSKGMLALPARIGKTGLDAVGAAFSPIAAPLTAAIGPEVQAVTGIQEQTVGNLLSGPVAGRLGGASRLLRGAKPGEIGAGPSRAMKPGEKPRTDMRNTANVAPPKPAAAASSVPSMFARTGALGAVQRTFSPETVSENARETATIHRMAHGVRRAEAAADSYAMERHQRVVGNATPAQQTELANYIDTRSTAAPLSDARLQPAADASRNVALRYRSRIENVLSDDVGGGPTFVKDYFARMYKNKPEEVEAAMARQPSGLGGRQGSGKNLKARTLPTYQDGLDAGLTPLFSNPLDAMNAYVDNMATFLATHDVQNEMKSRGFTKWAFEGKVPAGYTKLEGVRTTKPASLVESGALIPQRVLVAPVDVARVYNRTVSKGLDQGSFAGVYQGARAASNAVSQMKLGLSAFHATVMSEEGLVSEFAKGLKRVSKGDIGGVGDMLKSPLAPIRTATRGGMLRKAILDPEGQAQRGMIGKVFDKTVTPFVKGLDPRLADIYVRAGGRVNMDRFYNTSSVSGGFWRGFKNGTFTREVTDSMKRVGTEPIRGSLSLFGKTMDTVSAPIFKEYVPRMKAGAWASQMERFLKENEGASAMEQQRYAENLVNNMDNRFGELIVGNQFWEKTHFQLAQLLMLSPSWNFGTAREIGGGISELPRSIRSVLKGQGLTDKTAYVAALGATFMIQNGIATYLHTGEMPEGQDWLAYRTGGTDKDGAPERGLIPGYMKDVLSFSWNFPHNVLGEITNKANPALTTAVDLFRNKDYFDTDIYRPADDLSKGPENKPSVAEQAGQSAAYVGEQMTPISLSQQDRGPNSKFSTLETMLGIRRAPGYLENPEKKTTDAETYDTRDWAKRTNRDAKQAAQKEDNAKAKSASPSNDPFAAFKPDPFAAFGKKPDAGPRVKPGASNAGALRPEMKPILDMLSSIPGFNRITSENDSYHPAGDVHGQGKAIDFSVKGSSTKAAADLRRRLSDAGIKAKVYDEYNSPSRRATAGHIHVQLA